MDVLWEYLGYQVFMVRMVYVHAVDTRPFLPHREGPGDEASMGGDTVGAKPSVRYTY